MSATLKVWAGAAILSEYGMEVGIKKGTRCNCELQLLYREFPQLRNDIRTYSNSYMTGGILRER